MTKISAVFPILFVCVSLPFYSQNNVFTSPEVSSPESSGARSAEAGFAEQEFRRGVQAYYRGNFNDAIFEFEKALSYLPSENIILDWLGKAYYRSGLEGNALRQWSLASENGYGGLLLQNRIEIAGERRVSDNLYLTPVKYTEAGSFSGINEEKLIFSQPVSVLPNPDGTMWITAYGSNEMIRMDLNGFVFFRSNGPFNGFDRPMDIMRLPDENLVVSEFAGDRLSLFDKNGKYIKSFGSKGIGLGNVIGPQYIAVDEHSNIYVTDFGNSRVDVFDKEGNALFYFGSVSSLAVSLTSSRFSGLKAPTGIAALDGFIYVADAVTGAVYKFDYSGNYISLLCREKTFVRPESMKQWNGYLVICDSNKVYSIDIETGSVFENLTTGNAPSFVTSAVPDANGNILVTDFNSNEVYVMSQLSELVGGLFVQIDRVYSENFPKITLEVKVENRHRQSIVGLKEANFTITEDKNPVADYKFEGASYVNDVADITLVLDRGTKSIEFEQAAESAVREIASAMNSSGVLRIISAGKVPILEYSGSPSGAVNFNIKNLKTPSSNTVSIDLALRLAANGIINGEKKRGIVMIGSADASADSFSQYSLSDITSYFNNNSIAFSYVTLMQTGVSDEINYLCANTDGSLYYVYRERGLSDVVKDIINIPSGIYVLSYTSSQPSSFGQRYIPVEVETALMRRSGRDETGYFAPLQ